MFHVLSVPPALTGGGFLKKMPTFEDIAAVNIDIHSILNSIFKADNIQRWVLDTIKQRIESSGITGSQKQLKTDKAKRGNPYSDVTMDIKSFIGQSIQNVTLKDTGDFYDSFKFALTLFGFEIDANFNKKDGNIAKNFTGMYGSSSEFENDVLSLTDDEIERMIRTFIIPQLKIKIHEALYIT